MPSSKRRKGYPSETRVKRGSRVVHGDKELLEKLGRNDLCPCGSGRKFKKCCLPKLPAAVPKALADEYRKQMKLETLVFFTEENHQELMNAIPPEEYEARMKELELQRAKAKVPPYVPIPNAWLCPKIGCGCSNHDDLLTCHECDEPKPQGERLIQAREDAVTVQKSMYEKKLQEQIEKEKTQ